MPGKLLHEVEPRETKGRETIERFTAQFRAAAYMALFILENDGVDCIFCDYHEDYVVRTLTSNGYAYDFYQVKTKEKSNYQWDLLDVYSILKKGSQEPKRIRESFAGKLIQHTVNFGSTCRSVNLQTNVQFADEACAVESAFKNTDRKHKHAKYIFENFCAIFQINTSPTQSEIEDNLSKFKLIPGSQIAEPSGENFLALARERVCHYSEIDLSYLEFIEVSEKLLALVQKKSFQRISDVDEKSLQYSAGVALDDLLGILSLSPEGYRTLRDSGDSAALKNASIIQRIFSKAGADNDMINYLCETKVAWDQWKREKRHNVLPFEANLLATTLYDIAIEWMKSDGTLHGLFLKAQNCGDDDKTLSSLQLDKDLILGGILSEIVRSQT